MNNKKRMIVSFGIMLGTISIASIVTIVSLKLTNRWLVTQIDKSKISVSSPIEFVKLEINGDENSSSNINDYEIKIDGQDTSIVRDFSLTIDENKKLIFTSSNKELKDKQIIIINKKDGTELIKTIPTLIKTISISIHGTSLSKNIKDYLIDINGSDNTSNWSIDSNNSSSEKIVFSSNYNESLKEKNIKITVLNVKKGSSDFDIIKYP